MNGQVSEAFEIVSSIVDDILTAAVTGKLNFIVKLFWFHFLIILID